jgi:hypothetical protein
MQAGSIAPRPKRQQTSRPPQAVHNQTPAKPNYSPPQTQILDLNCSRIQSNIALKFNRWIEQIEVQSMDWTN